MIKWEYFKENIMSERPVAILKNEYGFKLLEVYEARDGHYTISNYDFIKSFSISYSDESDNIQKAVTDTTDDILFKRLQYGCAKIEENYDNQRYNILSVLSVK